MPMHVRVHHTSFLNGQITPPASKSQTIRALFFALLSSGTTHLENILISDDTADAIRIINALGGLHVQNDTHCTIQGSGLPFKKIDNDIYTGNSGIATHFMLPLLGLREGVHRPVYVDCGDQMRFRPMRVLITALRTLGMTIESDAFPLRVSGQLIGGEIFIEGYSSQPLSALLIALPAAQKDSVIHVNHLHEAPYIEMTLEWLKKQRIQITRLGNSFYIPGKQTYQPFDYTIPGDYSSASTFFAAAALFPGKITINGLDIDDLQGDKKIIEYVQLPLHGVEINAHDIPDLLPILAVLGTAAAGRTDILNTPGARLKETDRIHSMTQGLRQMGAKIEELSDGLIVYQSSMQGTHVKGFSDHRTVMALTLAGLLAQGTTVIEDAESVNKTYPRFFQDLKSLGAQLELENV